MTRVPVTVWGYAIPLLCVVLVAGTAFGAEEPAKTPEPKAQPPKTQEQKPAEPKKEKEEKKEEQKAQTPPSPQTPAPVPAQKPHDTKPDPGAKPPESKSDAKKEETKKEELKAPASAPQPAPPQKAQEQKPPENGVPPPPSKPAVPPIIATKLALMADPRLFPYEINVEVSGDVAELSGKVAHESEKAAATEIVQALEGLKSVTNNIEVVKDLNKTMAKKKDEIITQYVKDRFGKSKTLETAHFDVKSEDGIVSLSGKTKFLVIVLEAAEAARQVPGVKAVKTDGIRLEGVD